VLEGNKVEVGARALKSLNEARLGEGGQRDADRDSDTDDGKKEFVGGGQEKASEVNILVSRREVWAAPRAPAVRGKMRQELLTV
jgi:hypothetical protein